MERVILSGPESAPRCWMEDGYLYTTEREVFSAWPWHKSECLVGCYDTMEWIAVEDDEENMGHAWRIELSAVSGVYRYVEESLGCVAFFDITTGSWHVEFLSEARRADGDPWKEFVVLHRRAAIVCDTAEQFRAFHQALQEVSHE